MTHIILIFIAAAVTNNFVLAYFLGVCPFLGVSKRIESAFGMGLATTFVMCVAAILTWLIYHFLLIPFNLLFLRNVTFILVIASAVQVVEMFLKKFNPVLYRALGIYLPLITTNCAILGLALFMVMRQYNFFESVAFAVGGGVGFTFALTVMAGIREELEMADVPASLKGAGITLITAGLLALIFMGFAGIIAT
ncbi:MAG: electron transport complex subunit RsxA [Candidatus Omnitrophica bacterium]|nr:electron transport complex subunit RsxA [Candidatus Omnitrophota bacterium]